MNSNNELPPLPPRPFFREGSLRVIRQIPYGYEAQRELYNDAFDMIRDNSQISPNEIRRLESELCALVRDGVYLNIAIFQHNIELITAQLPGINKNAMIP